MRTAQPTLSQPTLSRLCNKETQCHGFGLVNGQYVVASDTSYIIIFSKTKQWDIHSIEWLPFFVSAWITAHTAKKTWRNMVKPTSRIRTVNLSTSH
jgi:hypothetical protein